MRCGCDLLHVSRITDLLDRRPAGLLRIFTEREVLDSRRGGVDASSVVAHRRLAARWAAKEATIKALGRRDLGPHDVEVRTRPSGAPELWVEGCRTDLGISLSHDGDLALAFVVVPGDTADHLSTAHPNKEPAHAAG